VDNKELTMFDELVKIARIEGAGDLLEGLKIMNEDIESYDPKIQAQFRHFMLLGTRMFAHT
jgi:hypothetical protein